MTSHVNMSIKLNLKQEHFIQYNTLNWNDRGSIKRFTLPLQGLDLLITGYKLL